MNNLIIILKKDLTIDKMSLVLITILSIGIPIYITLILENSGVIKGTDLISLLLSSLYCYFMIIGKLGLIEHKYKGTAYLTLTPITRKDIVKSKYLLLIVLFAVALLGYEATYLVASILHPLSLTAIITVFTIDIVFLGIYIPLEIKFGYENAKFCFMAVILISPFLVGLIGKFGGVSIFQRFMQKAGNISIFMVVLSVIVLSISYCVSLHIYTNKDL